MNDLFLIVVGISGLFFLLLFLKTMFKKKFCVLCGSVAGMWVLLLVLYRTDFFQNPIILALLMGQSITGIYYLLEQKLPERFHVFRLPFILSMIIGFYWLIVGTRELMYSLIFVASLWIVFSILYMFRSNRHFHNIVEKLIACCKNW